MTTFAGAESTAELPEDLLAEFFSVSDRGATIVAMALIDDGLREQIQAKLSPVQSARKDPLFRGALLNSSVRAILAHRMGLIDEVAASRLEALREIRNDYAHIRTDEKNIQVKCDKFVQSYFGLNESVDTADIRMQGTYICPPTEFGKLLLSNAHPSRVIFRVVLLTILAGISPTECSGQKTIRLSTKFEFDQLGGKLQAFILTLNKV